MVVCPGAERAWDTQGVTFSRTPRRLPGHASTSPDGRHGACNGRRTRAPPGAPLAPTRCGGTARCRGAGLSDARAARCRRDGPAWKSSSLPSSLSAAADALASSTGSAATCGVASCAARHASVTAGQVCIAAPRALQGRAVQKRSRHALTALAAPALHKLDGVQWQSPKTVVASHCILTGPGRHVPAVARVQSAVRGASQRCSATFVPKRGQNIATP